VSFLTMFEVRDLGTMELESCPLCLEVPGKSQRYFATHVGKHMEAIALAALPRDDDFTDSESMASSASSMASGFRRFRPIPNAIFQTGPELDSVFDPESCSGLGASTQTILLRSIGINDTQILSGESASAGKDSASAEILPKLSAGARDRIYEHALKPLLAKSSPQVFHHIVTDCKTLLNADRITSLRDIEKTLFFLAQVSSWRWELSHSSTNCPKEMTTNGKAEPILYLDFSLQAIRSLKSTIEFLSTPEQIRPHDIPYTDGYFADLTHEVKQFAYRLEEPTENGARSDVLGQSTDA
jgi:hypothetical protein